MTVADLQQRLVQIAAGLGRDVPNGAFHILAADSTERGINLATPEGQEGIERVLNGADLVILDNLSTLFPNGSESASDGWVPMQNWLLKLRRRGVAVLFVHHTGTNGRQRGTSRREDVLDTVIALRRPKITPLTRAPDSRFTSRSCGIGSAISVSRSRRRRSPLPPRMAAAGSHGPTVISCRRS